ncbi:hypothetical protein GCM10023199_07490 [Actinomycetospora chibensis]
MVPEASYTPPSALKYMSPEAPVVPLIVSALALWPAAVADRSCL